MINRSMITQLYIKSSACLRAELNHCFPSKLLLIIFLFISSKFEPFEGAMFVLFIKLGSQQHLPWTASFPFHSVR